MYKAIHRKSKERVYRRKHPTDKDKATRTSYELSSHRFSLNGQARRYGLDSEELKLFYEQSKSGKTALEWSEDIEILRFLELGLKVKMVELFNHTHAVDFPEDIEIVEDLLNEHK